MSHVVWYQYHFAIQFSNSSFHCFSLLTFEDICYKQTLLVFSQLKVSDFWFNIRHNDFVNHLQRFSFIGPMVRRVSNVKAIWEVIVWMTFVCFPFVCQLYWQKFSRHTDSKFTCNLAGIRAISYGNTHFALFCKGVGRCWIKSQWCLVNVDNQLRRD